MPRTFRCFPAAGRHTRRARRRTAVATAAATALALLLLPVAGALAGAVAVLVAAVVLATGTWRTLAAQDADAQEERWLRTVLDRLVRDVADEDENPDLLVW